jgi:hypothetical protein
MGLEPLLDILFAPTVTKRQAEVLRRGSQAQVGNSLS